MINRYKKSVKYLYVGYIVQAIVNNLLPLFFVMFSEQYNISTKKLGSLIMVNFIMQLIVDLLASKYGDKLGYRRALVLAHVSATIGVILISVMPMILSDTYLALVIATFFFAVGGGLIEVMVSPLMDAINSGDEGKGMSFLHSFYCWGQVAVVLISTLFLVAFGQDKWMVLPFIWAIVPFLNIFPFIFTPLPETSPEHTKIPLNQLFKHKVFILFIILMVSAGAAELAMSQWASYFAEVGLGVSKTVGDLLGPCAFAVLMGIARVIYGIYGANMKLKRSMLWCALLGIICYALAGISQNPYLSLVGCAVCGFSVGLMWPGTISLAGETFKGGGTAMFAILAMSGDLGCALGPWFTGIVSDYAENNSLSITNILYPALEPQQTSIKLGVLAGVIFPLVTVISLLVLKHKKKRGKNYEA